MSVSIQYTVVDSLTDKVVKIVYCNGYRDDYPFDTFYDSEEEAIQAIYNFAAKYESFNVSYSLKIQKNYVVS